MGIVIDKIVFENFRQYGSATLHFNCDDGSKLSVLIAKNGTGKTTLLNSITWCLYEKEQQLIDKKSALPVVSTAKLEKVGEGEIIPVSVSVTILDGDQIIEFKRSQKFKRTKSTQGKAAGIASSSVFSVSTTVKGAFENTSVETGADAEIVVKKYFDPAIYDFYFFDGEQLREFFSPERTTHIKSSIFNIAQVTLLQNAYDHVEKMRSEKMRKLGKNNPDISDLLDEQELLKKQRNLAQQTLESNQTIKEKLVAKREQADEVLRGFAPIKSLQNERKRLENDLDKCDGEKKKLSNDRSEFIRKYIILIKLYPRVRKTLELIRQKEEGGDLPPSVDKTQIKRVLEHLDEPCPLCAGKIDETGRQHLENLLNQISVSSKTSNYLKEIKGSLEYYDEEVHKYHARKEAIKQREMDLEEQTKKIEDRLATINATLVNYAESDGQINVSEVEKNRSQLISQISTADMEIGSSSNAIKSYTTQIESIQKKIDEEEKKLNTKNGLKKQIHVLVQIEDYFKRIKDSITDTMRKEIEITTWNFFDSMIWKHNTFGKISISDNYSVAVYNQEDTIMTGSLSATEQMALAYAFTLAIHEASGKNCPLVIDSPLGRVSDDNRENMAKALMNVSKEKQIIMLFTPDEYSSSVRDMYENVADVRTLQLSADEKFVEGIDE